MHLRILALILLFNFHTLFGQVESSDPLDSEYLNWYNKDHQMDGLLGTSVEKAYQYLAAEKKEGKTVVVAVIDGGVDIDHEDLKGKIWVNADEIPGNGIDDDQNGYVDDIHGWNFIGNAAGENINQENLEFTRIVRNNNPNDPLLESAQSKFSEEVTQRKQEQESIMKFKKAFEEAKSVIASETGIEVQSAADLDSINTTNPQVMGAKEFLKSRYDLGFTEESLEKVIDYYDSYLKYYLNLDHDVRSVVGDNPADIEDKAYGNADVKGPRADHGTSVSGVIAANRNNDIGINGVATHVKIMCIRSTPDGDERDKDVALAIRYAVDNGADIINMSFGKGFSPYKKWVDEAVKHADKNGVLLVHAAGNSGENIDVSENYPNDQLLDGSVPTNWISVGASSPDLDMDVAAEFSNYGKKQVDIFAPGVKMVSTDTAGTYSINAGTSLAAPVVSGIAAMVLSYYPDLSPREVIDILMSSAFKIDTPKKVYRPSDSDKKKKTVKFKALAQSGGVVNAYAALLEAEKRAQ